MQIGNWVPLDKSLVKFLPKNRVYSELEAVFSLSVDYDNGNAITVSGYAGLWGWSRTKVNNLFDDLGIIIVYPDDTQKKQKQKGQIEKQKENRKETEKRLIRFIDSKWLKETKNRKETEKKQKRNRSKDTTIDPSLNPNPEPIIKDILKPENVTDQTWNDFITHRKIKKAPITQTAMNTFTKQAELAVMSLEDALIETISRGWVGFKAEWMKNNPQNSFKKTETKSLSQIIEERRGNLKPDFDIEIQVEN